MTAHRISLSLITGVLGVSDRPGYARGDNEHTAWATLLITDLARIYEGALNHPFGPDRNEMPPPSRNRHRPNPEATTPSSSRSARSRPFWPL